MVISPQQSGLRVTGVSELAGLDAPARYETILQGLKALQQAMPGVNTEIQSQWRGFRPSMPDSLPVIGASRLFNHCYFAFGHGHLGLTLGPLTGRLIANAMMGEPTCMDITPFSPARYGA